ncbi:Cell wall assembly regulator [Vanrija albida]|uniref:Cell wall assembly regulator n=1 Tax=Vanrija albida TaxID=181172 RepID=A0ABR3Q9R2_9TREE
MPFLQSITSLFSGSGAASASSSRSHAARRSIAMTQDAFSMPSSARYGNANLEPHDLSPGPSRRNSAYTSSYPPAAGEGFAPTSTSYPPLSHTFHRLRNALSDSFPELVDSLNLPSEPAIISEFEHELGCPLPPAVRDSFLVADGQDLEGGGGGIFYGLYLLPLDEVVREWQFWRQVEADPRTGANPVVLATMASIPPQWVKSVYACRGWLPLLSDRTGNYVGVDLDPGPAGHWGQVIIFGRDFDRKCVVWRGEGEGGWGKWLASFVDEVEAGENWETDKSLNSDDEEELGYGSYNGGQTYGDLGRTLTLAGEYRGWSVLEAWWDKSTRQWEALGLGMDVNEIERGLDEARRLTGSAPGSASGKGKDREETDAAIEIRSRAQTRNIEIPDVTSPKGPPSPGDHESLLPPSSPEAPVPSIFVPNPLGAPSPTAARQITPLATVSDHPLKPDNDLLSPPARSLPGQKRQSRRVPPPAPVALDLPTRADVQAAQAVARAESTGLRGGWIMNLDTSSGAAQRRTHNVSPSLDAEMVDIDLEGGRQESFGTPRMRAVDYERQAEEDRLAQLGIEHRRTGGALSPQLVSMSRTPSPLSRNQSFDRAPVAPGIYSSNSASTAGGPPSRDSLSTPPPGSVAAVASNLIREPPRVVDSPRSRSPAGGDVEREIIRGNAARRRSSATPAREDSSGGRTRDNSLLSADSHDGLLDPATAAAPAQPTEPLTGTTLTRSPPTITTTLPAEGEANGTKVTTPSTPKARAAINVDKLVDGLEDVAL